MLTLSPAAARGRTRIDWLDSRHTFSFGEWYDPAHMGFRALRVINDDRVAPGGGFPTHGHADMEIVSYVLEEGQKAEVPLGAGRHAWVHVARGAVTVNGRRLAEGDGAALSDERALALEGHGGEVLVFDLA